MLELYVSYGPQRIGNSLNARRVIVLLKEAKGKSTPTMLDGSFSPLCVDIVWWCVMYTRTRNMMYTYIILYIPLKLLKECHLYQ